MRHNVGVTVPAEIEADTEAAWVGIGTRIGYLRKSCGVGEAESDGGGRAVEVGCSGEIVSCLGGCEGAVEHQTASMSCVRDSLVCR